MHFDVTNVTWLLWQITCLPDRLPKFVLFYLVKYRSIFYDINHYDILWVIRSDISIRYWRVKPMGSYFFGSLYVNLWITLVIEVQTCTWILNIHVGIDIRIGQNCNRHNTVSICRDVDSVSVSIAKTSIMNVSFSRWSKFGLRVRPRFWIQVLKKIWAIWYGPYHMEENCRIWAKLG